VHRIVAPKRKAITVSRMVLPFRFMMWTTKVPGFRRSVQRCAPNHLSHGRTRNGAGVRSAGAGPRACTGRQTVEMKEESGFPRLFFLVAYGLILCK
jgi:hypothetical protein